MALFVRAPLGLPTLRAGPGFLDLVKNDSFLDWKLARAQNLFVDGHKLTSDRVARLPCHGLGPVAHKTSHPESSASQPLFYLGKILSDLIQFEFQGDGSVVSDQD